MKIAEHFTTSDGQQFYKEDTARSHARTLANKKVVSPGEEIIEVDINEIEVDAEELIPRDQSQTGEATNTLMIGTEALTDGSENVLTVGTTTENLISDLPVLSIVQTQEAISAGGEEIKNIETPKKEAVKVEEIKENQSKTKK